MLIEKENEEIEKRKKEEHDKTDEVKDKQTSDLKESIKKKGHMGRMFGISDP